MQSVIDMDFTWSTNRVAAGSANNVFLLMEWRSNAAVQHEAEVSALAASRIQLHLQLASGSEISGLYGCRGEVLNDRDYTLFIGSLCKHMEKRAVIGLRLEARSSGKYPVATGLCTYTDFSGNQVILPSKTVTMDFSNHTSVLRPQLDKRVIKYLKMLQAPRDLEQGLQLYEEGYTDLGEQKIRRRADELLLLAARMGDTELLDEADMLYRLGDTFNKTHEY